MATSNAYENGVQCKTCRCGESDTNIWTSRTSDNPDKQIQKCPHCHVLKSGPLLLSSKGIGWTSWKKRWFILTRTSLVFYRSDPNASPQKGSETNLTLGGIDLNNSGSVVVKADKKLLTVLFPDGRDGRTFTLKAESSEDLYEWRTALENALVQAPSPAFATGQNGILQADVPDSLEASFEQWKERRPAKSLVIGRPILLALEDIDGSPSFLEKALRFIEEHGIKVEGILRQSADVEEVERRVREYEEGIVEFTPDEDAHVVGDCIKHVLRELPSSPVPATCCTALVEAYRTDRGSRITSMRAAIAETFPEPNRRLVQRILKMMLTVSSHKSVNRMTLSAVAACMAPLLLRPLLAGDCELEDDFNMGGDGSLQLLQAAAAANHAQAIVIILLEEFERIFVDDILQEGSLSSDLYSESEDGDVDDDELTDTDILDDGYNDPHNVVEADIEDDAECSFSGTHSEDNSDVGSDLYKASDDQDSDSSFRIYNEDVGVTRTTSNKAPTPLPHQKSTDIALSQSGLQKDDNLKSKDNNSLVDLYHEPKKCDANTTKPPLKSVSHAPPSSITNCMGKSNEPVPKFRGRTVWGRTPARKNLSMESIDFSSEDEIAIQSLEVTKNELQTKITKEIKGNEILQASLEKRRELLHERRLALEQDVKGLQEQLQKEVDLHACLEAGRVVLPPGQLEIKLSIDGKTRANLEKLALAEVDVNNLKQKVTDLSGQLCHQLQQSLPFLCEPCSQQLYAIYHSSKMEQQKVVGSSTRMHQNENSLKDEERLSGLAMKSVHARKQDSPSSPTTGSSLEEHHVSSESQNNTSSSGLNSSQPTKLLAIAETTPPQSKILNNENSMLGTECQNLRIHTQNSPSSPSTTDQSRQYAEAITVSSIEPTTLRHNTSSKKTSPKGEIEKKEPALKNSKMSTGSSSAPCDNESATIVQDAPSKMTSSRDGDPVQGPKWENMIIQSQDIRSSPDNHSPQKSKTKNRSSKYAGSNNMPSIKEPSTTSTKSSFKGETEKERAIQSSMGSAGNNGASCAEELKPNSQDADSKKSSLKDEKLQPNTTNQSSTKSSRATAASSTEEPTVFVRSTASKRSSVRGETAKKEAPDPQSLTNRQRASTRPEQTATSTSSALAKLTNRLNFLKERRLQLANELQNLDANRTLGSEGPPRTNSR